MKGDQPGPKASPLKMNELYLVPKQPHGSLSILGVESDLNIT